MPTSQLTTFVTIRPLGPSSLFGGVWMLWVISRCECPVFTTFTTRSRRLQLVSSLTFLLSRSWIRSEVLAGRVDDFNSREKLQEYLLLTITAITLRKSGPPWQRRRLVPAVDALWS